MTPIELFEQRRPEMTKSELVVADYIKENPVNVVRYTLTDLAKFSGSSNAVIIRLCQKLGYDGYSEFKFSMSRYLLSNVSGEVNNNTDPMQNIISTYLQYISQIPSFIDEKELQKSANFINDARQITIWGVNRTYLSACQLSHRLMRMGVPNSATDDSVRMMDYSNILKKGDLCILFTVGGKGSTLYPELFQRLKERGCSTILFTMAPKLTSISKSADINIVLPCIGQAGRQNFYDDQTIFFVFIELLLYEVARTSQGK